MNIKNIAMWAIIVFLTIGLYNMFKNPQSSNIRGGNQIIFSDFLEVNLFFDGSSLFHNQSINKIKEYGIPIVKSIAKIISPMQELS